MLQRCYGRGILAHRFIVHCRGIPVSSARSFFRYMQQAKTQPSSSTDTSTKTQDDMFHPLSSSPFPELRARAQSIKKMSHCPVCTHVHTSGKDKINTPTQPKMVEFDCPDCGYPTHCSENHWRVDEEHRRYCSRLREINEDDHDLRSRRQKIEYVLPGTLLMMFDCRSTESTLYRRAGI